MEQRPTNFRTISLDAEEDEMSRKYWRCEEKNSRKSNEKDRFVLYWESTDLICTVRRILQITIFLYLVALVVVVTLERYSVVYGKWIEDQKKKYTQEAHTRRYSIYIYIYAERRGETKERNTKQYPFT